MDVLHAVRTYTTKMVSTPNAIKVLLLDTHTTPIISLASTQSDLLTHQVYLTDRIDNMRRERMPHLKCVCFLSPSEESLEAIRQELGEPKYGEYYLYFSNVLSKSVIEGLAEADTFELVREVQEFFADYSPILPYLFSLNHTPSEKEPLYGSSSTSWSTDALRSTVHSISAVLLSLKKKPLIRYERMSPMAKRLGSEVKKFTEDNAALFDFRPTQTPPVLVILDRLNDPVTPLLSQWTYQAMVHELLGIINGRVDLSHVPDVTPELREITLNPQSDPFYAQHLLSNFGDLGEALKSYVDAYQTQSSSSKVIETVADMKRFVESYPEFRKLGGNVAKHVALVGELSRLVGRDKLLDVSEAEQTMVGTGNTHANDLKTVQNIIQDPGVLPVNKLRLAMLYALRYQRNSGNAIDAVVDLLKKNGVSENESKLVYVVLHLAGADKRQGGLFSNATLFSRGRSALKGLKGVENVYTQHTPLMAEMLDPLLKGKLRDTSYPFIDPPAGSNSGAGPQNPGPNHPAPQDVILFMVGGTTYEEAKLVAKLNAEAGTSGTRILLGGTCIHNSSRFVTIGLHQDHFLYLLQSAASTVVGGATSVPETTAATTIPGQPPTPGLNVQLGGIQTMEDVKIKTRTGGLLTLISAAVILSFTMVEFLDYRRVHTDTSIIVDRSRGEKLNVVFNVTFPRVPCYLVSVDVTDISGELQTDLTHNILKTRINSQGDKVETSVLNELKSDLDKAASARGPNYCGSCYGGMEPEGGCCQTCEDVRQAYLNRGWSFSNPDSIEQCVSENWTEKIQAQSGEGCNIAGRIKVNKVVGNLLFSPGRSFQTNGVNFHDLVPYLKDTEVHNWGHVVENFRFESDEEGFKVRQKEAMMNKLGWARMPLDKHYAHARTPQYMFQYFLKVVSTRYKFLNRHSVGTHQYSVTTYQRDLGETNAAHKNAQGLMASRQHTSQPGVYFNFEISPMQVHHVETRQSFAHFLTSTCAIVGGVLTIATLLDSFVFSATSKLKGGAASSNGKMM
ncbi:Sec1-domain-containing protein [Clavulina sp. PMI_390]|nr:Sec1-domain-containing protein [Clavulina sp. PMI_390]